MKDYSGMINGINAKKVLYGQVQRQDGLQNRTQIASNWFDSANVYFQESKMSEGKWAGIHWLFRIKNLCLSLR